MAEQKSVALSLAPWSKFLFRNSLTASENHRKGGIFHMMTDGRALPTGREVAEREW